MKTNRIIMAALIAAAAVSCQKESFDGVQSPRETESATIVAGEMTKTSLNGNEVHWTSDDVIAVFDNADYKNRFAVTSVNGASAAFSGTVTAGTTRIYAVYPYDLVGSASGSTISVNVPVDQTPKVGSFAEEHNISVAKAVKTPGVAAVNGVIFRNVCSYLKFTIPSYINDAKKITFSTSRAIAGAAAVDASADAPVAVAASDASTSVSMQGSYSAGDQCMFVLTPGDINGFTVTIETDNATWSITRSTSVNLAAGQYRNLGTLELERADVSATATHTLSGNTLTGTTVSVALDVSSATLKYASDLNIEVRNAAGTVVRSVSKTTLSASETLAANSEWPYLPQGTYTVSGSYMLGETVRDFSATFVSPKPTFGVTSHAYTSYTKYLESGAAAANAVKNDRIAGITSATVHISDVIMNNANYSSLKGGFTYKLDGSSISSSEVTGQFWGQHTVTATYTFDGAALSGSSDCHVTGLPYSAPSSTAFNASGKSWSKVNGNMTSINTNGLVLRSDLGDIVGQEPEVKSPYFNLPSNVKVNISLDCNLHSKYTWPTWYRPTLKVKVNGSTIISQKAGESENNNYTLSNNGTFTPSANYVVMETDKYAAKNQYADVSRVDITYAD